MAKKGKTKSEYSKGYKKCPKCEEAGRPAYVAGGRTAQCPDCGYEFPKPAAKGKPAARKKAKAAAASNGSVEVELAALRLIVDCGDAVKARQEVERIKDNSAWQFVKLCGGDPDSALKAIDAETSRTKAK
jgi:hypothetical protein